MEDLDRFCGTLRRRLRMEERGLHQGPQSPLRPLPLNYPPCAESQLTDKAGVMTDVRDSFTCPFVHRAQEERLHLGTCL
jgi:hypothetical protein